MLPAAEMRGADGGGGKRAKHTGLPPSLPSTVTGLTRRSWADASLEPHAITKNAPVTTTAS